MNDSRKYYAKLLLFGEYGVIYGAMGLSVPFKKYGGSFTRISEHADPELLSSNASLRNLYNYLADLNKRGELIPELNLQQLDSDLKAGLCFQSDIPQGFGIGSSGALCAAVYDKYVQNRAALNNENWDKQVISLKKALQQMENHYHGISSGLDPLSSYLQKPLLIHGLSKVRKVELNQLHGLHMFLVDTGETGKTGPLVNLFFEKLRSYSYYKKFSHKFIPANNKSVQAFLSGDAKLCYENLTNLSALTLDLLQPMIPAGFQAIWKKGLTSGDFLMKLCGSGGGGYLLGFTRDPETVGRTFPDEQFHLQYL